MISRRGSRGRPGTPIWPVPQELAQARARRPPRASRTSQTLVSNPRTPHARGNCRRRFATSSWTTPSSTNRPAAIRFAYRPTGSHPRSNDRCSRCNRGAPGRPRATLARLPFSVGGEHIYKRSTVRDDRDLPSVVAAGQREDGRPAPRSLSPRTDLTYRCGHLLREHLLPIEHGILVRMKALDDGPAAGPPMSATERSPTRSVLRQGATPPALRARRADRRRARARPVRCSRRHRRLLPGARSRPADPCRRVRRGAGRTRRQRDRGQRDPGGRSRAADLVESPLADLRAAFPGGGGPPMCWGRSPARAGGAAPRPGSSSVSSTVPEGKGSARPRRSRSPSPLRRRRARPAIEPIGVALLAQRAEHCSRAHPAASWTRSTAARGEAGGLLALLCRPAVVAVVRSFRPLAVWGSTRVRARVSGDGYRRVRCASFMGGELLDVGAVTWRCWIPSQRRGATTPGRMTGAEFLRVRGASTTSSALSSPR